MERESILFYRSFYEAIVGLPKEIQIEVYSAIMEYGFYGKLPDDLKPVAKGFFALIRPVMDANNKKFVNGKKGGRKPGPKITEEAVVAVPDPQICTSFEDEIALLKSEQGWCESTCMQFHIDRDTLSRRLDEFVMHCKVERGQEIHASLKDARRHFTSWMRKVNKPKPVETTQSNPADYTFKGGFGGLDT